MALLWEQFQASATDTGGTVAPVLTPSARMTDGEICVVFSILNHSSDSPSISDTSPGQTWVELGHVSNGDLHLVAYACAVSAADIETTETVTVTWAGSSGGRGSSGMFNFTSGLGAGGPFYLSFDAISATGTGTTVSVANASMPSDSKALIGLVAIAGPNGDTFTQDVDYANNTSFGTTGGVAATEASGRFGTRITALTADTYAPTLGTSRDWAALLIGIQETPPPRKSNPLFIRQATMRSAIR